MTTTIATGGYFRIFVVCSPSGLLTYLRVEPILLVLIIRVQFFLFTINFDPLTFFLFPFSTFLFFFFTLLTSFFVSFTLFTSLIFTTIFIAILRE